MTTRTRPPVVDRPDAPRRPRRPPQPPRKAGIRRFGPPALGGALVVGLLIGYAAHGGGGTKTVTSVQTVTAPASSAPPAASGAASRSRIPLAVLNGSGVSGLAHQTAEQARGMGYAQISEGNAPSTVTATKVYFRPGGAPEARQVAQDLNLPTPTRIPATGALDKAADAPAHVVVVLGPDAQIGSDPTATGGPDATSTAPGAGEASTAPAAGTDLGSAPASTGPTG